MTYDTNNGVQIADMRMLQPRLGVAWDLAGNAKNILRGSWGRFLHPGNLAGVPSHHAPIVRVPLVLVLGAVLLYFAIMEDSAEECAAVASELWGPIPDGPRRLGPLGWVLAPWESLRLRADQ